MVLTQLTISQILWHVAEGSFTRNNENINDQNYFENYVLKITSTFLSEDKLIGPYIHLFWWYWVR